MTTLLPPPQPQLAPGGPASGGAGLDLGMMAQIAQQMAPQPPTPAPIAPTAAAKSKIPRPSTPHKATSDSDLRLVGRIRALFTESRAHRRPIVMKWNRFYRVLRNRTYLNASSVYPAPEVPEILPIVEALVGWLTDQRPTFEVIPAMAPFSDEQAFFQSLADDLRVALTVNWAEYAHESVVELVARDAHQYGTGFFKTTWNNAALNGQGDAVLLRVDPYTFYPDPAASSMDDANYFIEARRMSIQEIDRRFPGASTLLSESRYNDTVDERPNLDNATDAPKANPGAISPSTGSSFGRPGQGRESISQDTQGVTVLEAWLREHSTDPDSHTIHDTWRCVVIAGPHILLNELAEDILPYPMHPYDRYVAWETGEFWGISMVELLLPAQVMINRLLGALQQNTELTGNPVLLETTRAGISRTKVTNQPGQRITMNDGGQAQWLVPPNMPTDFPNLIQFYIGEMERISGLSAITRGMAPGGRNAASVVDSLQEASFVRVRMASRQLERSLRSVGEKLASLIAEFYTEPRMVSLIGQNGERTSRALSAMHFYTPAEDGSAPLRFQLQVQGGSSLPTSRQARAAEADTLFAMGAIDVLSLLQAHNWPNAQMVLQRVTAQAQAAGTQPGPANQRTAARA